MKTHKISLLPAFLFVQRNVDFDSNNMSSAPLTVFIYEEEATLISNWTLEYLNIETGGDLFGLWLSESEIAVQAVLGPGKNCRRNVTSFFQDEQYLSNVGGFLTTNQGLCNIGGWHSHHLMKLPEPSTGDATTIWRHLPKPGRFLLLIATIETNKNVPKVSMTFSLFVSSDEGRRMVRMQCKILEGKSPLRANSAITSMLRSGAERGPSKRETRNKRLDRNVEKMCEGGRSYYSQQRNLTKINHSGNYNSQRNKTDSHYVVFEKTRDGRERVLFYHNHPPGPCNVVFDERYDGKLSRYDQHSHREEDCCTDCSECIIL